MPSRRDPSRLRNEIDELFADLWQVRGFAGARSGFRPQVDCFRTEDPPRITVVVELAGVDPEAVQVVATGRTLVISGERRRPPGHGRVYQQIEIDDGPFRREIVLGEDVDTAAATASYAQGLLTIQLPVAAPRPAQPKVPIAVRRSGGE
jgi:HSP20 family protein